MTPHLTHRSLLHAVALAALLLSQTGCMAALAAANQQEVEDRQKLKEWIAETPAYAQCQTPPMIAQPQYHDFDHDGVPEWIVEAKTCMALAPGPDIHAVLSPQAAGGFVAWDIPEITGALYDDAEMVGVRTYRYRVEGDLLIATWKDESGRVTAPLTVKYKPMGGDGRAFGVDDIAYGK